MEYARLAEVYSELEKTPGKLEKTRIMAELLKECGKDELAMVTMLLQGRVFPAWSKKEIGMATQLMIKALASNTGFRDSVIEKEFRESGDLGLVAEKLVSGKKQSTLFSKRLTTGMVFSNLREIAGVEGKNSQNRNSLPETSGQQMRQRNSSHSVSML